MLAWPACAKRCIGAVADACAPNTSSDLMIVHCQNGLHWTLVLALSATVQCGSLCAIKKIVVSVIDPGRTIAWCDDIVYKRWAACAS